MASSPVRATVEAYAAGRIKAERLVEAVVPAYFRAPPGKTRNLLQPLVAVIERAAPGVVELSGEAAGAGSPGFQVRLAERPFPQAFEEDLRRAAVSVLKEDWSRVGESRVATKDEGIVARFFGALRRLFSA